jgi:hypothetical protein
LDGSGSSDSDGTIASYTWKQTAGPSVDLNLDRPAHPTFIVPPATQDTTLTFSLVVTDDSGASTAANTVNIHVKNLPANLRPIANAGPDQTVNQNATVTLSGSASSDRDGTAIEYYQWTQTSGPLVVMNEIDEHVATPKAMFTAPNVGPNGATLVFRLTVFDSDGATASDTVNVNVNGGVGAGQQNATQATTTATAEQNQTNQEPTTTADTNAAEQNQTNQEPTADAGADQTVNEGDAVKLDGSASSDPDRGDTLTYSWTQTAGTDATLSEASSKTPTFTAPDVGTDGDTLTFKLTVNDGNGHTATDTVKVLVKDVPEPSPPDEITAATTTTTTATTNTTATSLILNPISNVPWGQTVTVSGKLTSADEDDGSSSAISGQSITLTGTEIKEEQTISTETQSDGTFTATFTAPSTVASGWTVQAHYAGNDDDDSNLQSSDSEERTFATLKHGSALSLILDPAQVAMGGSYSVHGELKDFVTSESIASMTIAFTADKPISIKSTTTDSSGNYQLSGLEAPSSTSMGGSYNIEAQFAGDSLYDSATSGKQTLVVVK